MPEQSVLREVVDEVRHEVRRRPVQLLAATAYVLLAIGGLYLFSSVGEDSRTVSDVHRRTTLAAVGTGLLGLGVVVCGATFVLDRTARRRVDAGPYGRVLPNRRRLGGMTVLGTALAGLGVWALTRWS